MSGTKPTKMTNEPWTIDNEPNPFYSDSFSNAYNLYWNGLVRGHLRGYEQSRLICAQLNLGNVLGVEVKRKRLHRRST